MISKKKLLENSFLYTFSGIFTKCINFILMPIYTAHLTTSDYGIYSLLGSFSSTTFYLVSLGLENAIIRFYLEYKEDKEKLKCLIGTCICSILIMDVIFSLICYQIRDVLTKSLLEGVAFYPFILISLIELGCLCINTIYRTVLKTMGEGRKLTGTSLGMFLVSTFSTILLVVVLHKGAVGMVAAIAISRFGLLIYAIYDLRKQDLIKISIELKILAKSLYYSVPLIPHQMSMSIATLMSKIFLNRADTLAAVGVYNVAVQISTVIDTFQDSVGQAYRPWLNEVLYNNEKSKEEQIQEVSEMLMYLFSFVFIGISFFSFEVIVLFFGDAYFNAAKLIPILAIAFSLKSIYYFYIYKCFYFTEIANKIFLVSVSSSFINIFISYFLAQYYGMYGTAIAQLIADAIRMVLTILLANSQKKIGYRLEILMKILLISWSIILAGVIFIYLFDINKFSWLLFSYKCILILLYMLLLVYKYRDKLKNIKKRMVNE